MNPFMEPTVARPLPAGTGLAGHSPRPSGEGPASAADRAPAPDRTSRPRSRKARRRQHGSASARRLPLPRALLVAGVLGLAGLILPVPASAVDVNQASEPELISIKGIGPRTAQGILAERQRGGPFASLTDLSERVKGIGPKKLASLKAAGLVVGPAGPTSQKEGGASAAAGKK